MTAHHYRDISNETFLFSDRCLAISRDSNVTLNSNRTGTKSTVPDTQGRQTLIVGRHVDLESNPPSKRKKHRSSTVDQHCDSSSLSSVEDENGDQHQFLSNSELLSAQKLYIRPWLARRATAPDIHCLENNLNDTRVDLVPQEENPSVTTSNTKTIELNFSIFPNDDNLDIYTRFTCLITILFYLRDIHDDNSNRILYEEIEKIEKHLFDQFVLASSSNESPRIYSNLFRTVNPDGTKRYRTGIVVDVNVSSSEYPIRIYSKQVDWKRVKVIVRRFRKKHQRHERLIKNDVKLDLNRSSLENYLKYFDSTSKRRVRKYAKHYADKS